jgi:hypothetical protein
VTKIFGLLLGDFSINASGHPDCFIGYKQAPDHCHDQTLPGSWGEKIEPIFLPIITLPPRSELMTFNPRPKRPFIGKRYFRIHRKSLANFFSCSAVDEFKGREDQKISSGLSPLTYFFCFSIIYDATALQLRRKRLFGSTRSC